MSRRLRLAAAVLAGGLATAGAAWAYWSVTSTPGGGGAAAAATVSTPGTPTTTPAGTSVTVTWPATTLSNGTAVSGYTVRRYDAGTMAPQTVGSGCSGTVTATSCVESGVPEGRWVYTVQALFAADWRSPESATSTAVWVDVTAPANNVTLTPVSGGSFRSGSTVFYRGASAGSLRLTNAVTDSLSGPASSTTSALSGTTTGWTHTPATVTTPAGGPFVSNLFGWGAATTSNPSVTVTGRDAAGNTAATGFAFVDDSTPPAATTTEVSGLVGTGSRYATATSLDVTFSAGADTGSGLAPSGNTLERQQGTLTSTGGADGVCSGYGAFGLVPGGTDPVSPRTDGVTDQACYRYRYNVVDNVGNVRANLSPDVKVDLTAPAAPGLTFSAFSNTWWNGVDPVVFYRSAAGSGSFTATAAATDDKSGVASYAMPTLPAGWATSGAGAARTYSWSAPTPTAPGSQSASATNHAGLTSPTSSFSLVADDAAPTGSSVSYPDGDTTSTTVTLTLANGSDGTGSGLGTRSLQRASAPLTDNACGSFSGFTTIANDPATTYNDTGLARDTCYRYQLVVPDRVGNSVTATSASTAKVQSYNTAVRATPGLVSQWRLGETPSAHAHDTFSTGTNGNEIRTRSGEVGGPWVRSAATGAADLVIHNSRVRKNGTNAFARYWATGAPAGADYTVEATVFVTTRLTNDWAGVLGRLDPAVTNGTYYAAAYDEPSQSWALYRTVNGTRTTLGTFPQALAANATHQLALQMSGSTIRLLVDGVERISVTDGTITDAGRGGLQQGNGTNNITVGTGTGMRLDNFRIAPPLSDGFGTNTGAYLRGVALGVVGAIAGDPSTAATFDGSTTHATATRQIGDDFSIELWFRSNQGIGTGTTWFSGAGLVDADVAGTANDFGISLRSDGRVVAGVGNPDTSIVSSVAGLNNNVWRHVVFTRTRSTGALALYVDGVPVGTATGGTQSLTGSARIDFGRIATGGNYYAGSLDEVAVYDQAIPAATVAAHWAAR